MISQLITNTLEHCILYLELNQRENGTIGDSIAHNFETQLSATVWLVGARS